MRSSPEYPSFCFLYRYYHPPLVCFEHHFLLLFRSSCALFPPIPSICRVQVLGPSHPIYPINVRHPLYGAYSNRVFPTLQVSHTTGAEAEQLESESRAKKVLRG